MTWLLFGYYVYQMAADMVETLLPHLKLFLVSTKRSDDG